MAHFSRNLKALQRHHPLLAQRVAACPLPEAQTSTTKSGGLTLEYQGVLLHSRYNPEREARALVDGAQPGSHKAFIIMGLGLGYHVRYLFEQSARQSQIFVVEPDITVLRLAMEWMPLGDLFASTRLQWLVQLDKVDIFTHLEPHLVNLFLGATFIHHPASLQRQGPAFAAANQAILEFIEYGTTSLYTASTISGVSRLNVMMNFSHALRWPGLNDLKNKYQGMPAVLIAAGPSLQKNLHLLKDASVIKLCVGTALKKCLSEGVRPHFVGTIDYHPTLTRRYFESLPDVSDITLVADAKASWRTVDAWPGPLCLIDSHVWTDLLPELSVSGGAIMAGATVAHLCFFLAQHMGCDPITVVGQDLAFTGHATHATGTAIHDSWIPETGRFNTLEMKEWDDIVRRRKDFVKVPGVQGDVLYTDRQMFTYMKTFEKEFSLAPQRVIDATEGGALKVGSEVMTLKEALAQHEANLLPKREKLKPLSQPRADPERVEEFLELRWQTCCEVIDLYDRTLDVLKEMSDVVGEERFHECMNEVNRLRAEYMAAEILPGLIADLTQADEFTRLKNDREITASGLEGHELQKRQLERDIQYVSALKGGATFMGHCLMLARERNKIHPQKMSEDIQKHLREVDK